MGLTGFEILSDTGIIPLSEDSHLDLEESRDYLLRTGPPGYGSKVHWGERELLPREPGVWAFSTAHWSGNASFTIGTADGEFVIPVRARPRSEKIREELWVEILQDLEAWLTGATVGIEGGRRGSVGNAGVPVPLIAEALLPLCPVFWEAFWRLIRNLREIDVLVWEEVPLWMMKRVDRQTMKWVSRHPEVAVALDPWEGMQVQTPCLPRQRTEDVIDHPANRYVSWLVSRVARTLADTADHLRSAAARVTATDDSKLWCRARASRLEDAAAKLQNMVAASPLAQLRKQPATEAAFQVVVDDPLYARVHKIGRLFLNPLFRLPEEEVGYHAAVRSTFSIYEMWCFMAVVRQFQSLLHTAWTWSSSGLDSIRDLAGTGAGAKAVATSGAGEVVLHFNPTFRSFFVRGENPRWSVSGERRPDIVVTYRPADAEKREGSWFCLDAKYRVGVSNLSNAFESVHIYKDSLRYDGYGGKCKGCLLLSPTSSKDTQEWFSSNFFEEHKAGVWELRPRVEGHSLAKLVCRELDVAVNGGALPFQSETETKVTGGFNTV